MENITSLINDWSYGRDTSSNNTVGVVRNPDLGAGILLGYTLLGVATYIWAFWYQRDGLVLQEAGGCPTHATNSTPKVFTTSTDLLSL